jgi:hypothetical protein
MCASDRPREQEVKVSDLKNFVMALDAASLLCHFTVASDIFTLKDTAKTHSNNSWLNIPNNVPLVIYQATLARH